MLYNTREDAAKAAEAYLNEKVAALEALIPAAEAVAKLAHAAGGHVENLDHPDKPLVSLEFLKANIHHPQALEAIRALNQAEACNDTLRFMGLISDVHEAASGRMPQHFISECVAEFQGFAEYVDTLSPHSLDVLSLEERDAFDTSLKLAKDKAGVLAQKGLGEILLVHATPAPRPIRSALFHKGTEARLTEIRNADYAAVRALENTFCAAAIKQLEPMHAELSRAMEATVTPELMDAGKALNSNLNSPTVTTSDIVALHTPDVDETRLAHLRALAPYQVLPQKLAKLHQGLARAASVLKIRHDYLNPVYDKVVAQVEAGGREFQSEMDTCLGNIGCGTRGVNSPTKLDVLLDTLGFHSKEGLSNVNARALEYQTTVGALGHPDRRHSADAYITKRLNAGGFGVREHEKQMDEKNLGKTNAPQVENVKKVTKQKEYAEPEKGCGGMSL